MLQENTSSGQTISILEDILGEKNQRENDLMNIYLITIM